VIKGIIEGVQGMKRISDSLSVSQKCKAILHNIDSIQYVLILVRKSSNLIYMQLVFCGGIRVKADRGLVLLNQVLICLQNREKCEGESVIEWLKATAFVYSLRIMILNSYWKLLLLLTFVISHEVGKRKHPTSRLRISLIFVVWFTNYVSLGLRCDYIVTMCRVLLKLMTRHK